MLFGALVSVTNGSSWSIGVSLSLILGIAWSWAALGLGCGVAQPRARDGAIAAAVGLLAAVGSYYLTDLSRGVYRSLDPADPTRTFTNWGGAVRDWLVWSVISLIVGPVFGALGARARRGDLFGLACRLVVPLIAVVETSWRLPQELAVQPRPLAVSTLTTTRWLALGCAVLLIATHVTLRRRPTPRRR
ncbi:MAG: hypothetical protein U0Q19_13340 [Kineosporiaceae bacterium]